MRNKIATRNNYTKRVSKKKKKKKNKSCRKMYERKVETTTGAVPYLPTSYPNCLIELMFASGGKKPCFVTSLMMTNGIIIKFSNDFRRPIQTLITPRNLLLIINYRPRSSVATISSSSPIPRICSSTCSPGYCSCSISRHRPARSSCS